MRFIDPIKDRLAVYRRYFFKRHLIPFYAGLFVFAALIITSAVVAINQESHRFDQVASVDKEFMDLNYCLKSIRAGTATVPRVFIDTMPLDFNAQDSGAGKRDMFIKIMLPLILKKNESLRTKRIRFIEFSALPEKSRTAEQKEFLKGIYDTYGKSGNYDEVFGKLDEVSVSLALAQAIQETGWGSSRFLMDGNSIFAEWTWSGAGMVPRTRGEGKRHRIRTFPTLYDSVDAYAFNLNRTRYYFGKRQIRREFRSKNLPMRGEALARGIGSYATEKGYIEALRQIVIRNNLNDFEKAVLAPPYCVVRFN
ncbi:MAG: glucosaminidase domain-containing protein [Alphaproteobacteria bacterium]|nr:glucosaminidase domain-containing protein [Alphaproteobacteria bacterium]